MGLAAKVLRLIFMIRKAYSQRLSSTASKISAPIREPADSHGRDNRHGTGCILRRSACYN